MAAVRKGLAVATLLAPLGLVLVGLIIGGSSGPEIRSGADDSIGPFPGLMVVAGADRNSTTPPSTTPLVRAAVGTTRAGAPRATAAAPGNRRAPTGRPPTSTTPSATSRPIATPTPTAPAALAGCPVPPHPALPPQPPPWHPALLVPDASLPRIEAPRSWRSDLAPLTGTGMWIWQWNQTDHGNATAVVDQAVRAGLHQLWVRVGDSLDGFYGGPELAALVPAAHVAGLSVIAWGFPNLYDPVGDARWTAEILAWRGSGDSRVDGYSADIESSTEGVDLTAQRTAVYLQLVRQAAGDRLVAATVYAPTDWYWTTGRYPYEAIAPYVDAFAPMIYWGCTDPGRDAEIDIARLSSLRPVHIIGQAYNMASVGGRPVAPSGAEISEFLQTGKRDGAIGASFWVWQTATSEEWAALATHPW